MMTVLALLAQAVPPPVEQVTANCARPVYATDQLVCGDPELRAIDLELATALGGGGATSSPWLEPQTEWFKRRSRCAFAADHRACAISAYRERLAVAQGWSVSLTPISVRCNDRRIDRAVIDRDRIGFFVQGQLAGASLARPVSTWQPYLRTVSTDRRIKAAGPTGTLTCTRRK